MATEYYLVHCCQLNSILYLVCLLFLQSLFVVFKSLIFNISISIYIHIYIYVYIYIYIYIYIYMYVCMYAYNTYTICNIYKLYYLKLWTVLYKCPFCSVAELKYTETKLNTWYSVFCVISCHQNSPLASQHINSM